MNAEEQTKSPPVFQDQVNKTDQEVKKGDKRRGKNGGQKNGSRSIKSGKNKRVINSFQFIAAFFIQLVIPRSLFIPLFKITFLL